MNKLVLASSSKYRKKLLSRLGIPFDYFSPDIDESQHPKEKAKELVKRLSIKKSLASTKHNCFCLGSDQVAVFDDSIIGKPLTFDKAFDQLRLFSGNTIQFITGVALTNRDTLNTEYKQSVVEVKFRSLDKNTIESYLKIEQPYDCAGSFKVESLGICLFKSVHSDDPTSLEGLPLINVCSLLKTAGFTIPYSTN